VSSVNGLCNDFFERLRVRRRALRLKETELSKVKTNALRRLQEAHNELCKWAWEGRPFVPPADLHDLLPLGTLVECPDGTLGYVLEWLDRSTDGTSPDWDRRVAVLETIVSRHHTKGFPWALAVSRR